MKKYRIIRKEAYDAYGNVTRHWFEVQKRWCLIFWKPLYEYFYMTKMPLEFCNILDAKHFISFLEDENPPRNTNISRVVE